MANVEEVRVPDIGDFDAVDVVEVLVSAGDTVAEGDALILLESDKASMDVPATIGGVVKEVKVEAGSQVSAGDLVAVIEPAEGSGETPAAKTEQAEPAPEPKAESKPEPAAKPESASEPEPVNQNNGRPPLVTSPGPKAHASPGVRRFARELGISDLTRVNGSGRKGRITKDDVKAFVKQAMTEPAKSGGGGGFSLPEMPVIDFAKFGEIEEKPLSRIQKLSAANLHRSWLHVPHVTQHDEADITELEAFRKDTNAREATKKGLKLTPLGFIMKAVVAGLQEFPKFCSSLDPSGEKLILKKYYNLGIAVDTPNGLVVPVIRDVDKKGLFEIAAELGEVSARARDGKLKPSDLSGACFTISSLGGIGGTAFTPIVNAPEVAILGVSRSSIKPVWQGNEFAPRLMLPMSLSYDHRVIDGADAARFTTFLSGVLSDLRRLLL